MRWKRFRCSTTAQVNHVLFRCRHGPFNSADGVCVFSRPAETTQAREELLAARMTAEEDARARDVEAAEARAALEAARKQAADSDAARAAAEEAAL